jgi:hypothetical protein
MEEILDNIISGDSNPRYPLVPLIEIDMSSNVHKFRQHIQREAWVSYSLIWSKFEYKHKMDYKSICSLIENLMFNKYGLNIKAK